MATHEYTFKAQISDELLESVAIKNDYLDTDQEIPSNVYAIVKVIGTDFINDTIRRVTEATSDSIPPRDLPDFRESVKASILASTEVYMDGVKIYSAKK